MEQLAGWLIERFTPHDFRRISRSNTEAPEGRFETAEAMLNQVKKGLERTYETYELEKEGTPLGPEMVILLFTLLVDNPLNAPGEKKAMAGLPSSIGIALPAEPR